MAASVFAEVLGTFLLMLAGAVLLFVRSNGIAMFAPTMARRRRQRRLVAAVLGALPRGP